MKFLALAAVLLALPFAARADHRRDSSKAAEDASEQIPPQRLRGHTYNKDDPIERIVRSADDRRRTTRIAFRHCEPCR